MKPAAMVKRFIPPEESELEQVCTLAGNLCSEYKSAEVFGQFDPVHFQKFLFEAQPKLRLWATFESTTMVSLLLMAEYNQPLSGDLTLEEMFWYAIPEHRGALTNIRLFSEMESYAKSKKIRCIAISNLGGINSERVRRFYGRKGYALEQQQLFKRLDSTDV